MIWAHANAHIHMRALTHVNASCRVVFSKNDVKLTLEKKGKDFKDVPGTAILTEQRVWVLLLVEPMSDTQNI